MKARAVAMWWLVAAVVVVTAGGCASNSTLRVEPVQDSAVVVPRFDQAVYRQDRDGTLHFLLRGVTKDKATGEEVTQIVTARVFWKPIGGRTSLNPYSVNATFRYVLMRPDAVGMYEGAGFVRLSGKPGAKHLTARVIDADLRLTQASGDYHDTLGRSRLRGKINASYSDYAAVDETLQAHQDFFARSLALADKSKRETTGTAPKVAPASTQPAASEAAPGAK